MSSYEHAKRERDAANRGIRAYYAGVAKDANPEAEATHMHGGWKRGWEFAEDETHPSVTVRELLAALQELPEEDLDRPVVGHCDYMSRKYALRLPGEGRPNGMVVLDRRPER